MAADKLEIYNLTLVKLGEDRLAAIDADSEPRRKLDAIYDNVLEQVTVAGPEKGWKFTKIEPSVDIDSIGINGIINYDAFISGTVLFTTSAVHNLVTGDHIIILDLPSYTEEYEITVPGDTTFLITETYADSPFADATVYWTSANYAYRYAIPLAAKRVVKASVAGIELTDWITRGEYILTNLEGEKIWIEYVQSITDTTLFPAHFTKVLYMSLAIELSYNLIQSSTHGERLEDKLDRAMLKAIGLDEQEKQVTESSTAWVDAGR